MSKEQLVPEPDSYAFIDAIYSAAMRPTAYEDLFSVWDGLIVKSLKHDVPLDVLEDLRRAGVRQHFKRAMDIFEITTLSPGTCLDAVVAALPTAAWVVNRDGRIIAQNAAGQEMSSQVVGGPLDRLIDVREATSNWTAPPERLPVAYRMKDEKGGHPLVFIIERLPTEFPTTEPAPFFFIKSTEAIWRPQVNALLKSAFGFSEAECDVVRLLNNGLSPEEVAEARERSVQTIRAQIKSILAKSGAANRAELLRHVTALIHMLGADAAPSALLREEPWDTDDTPPSPIDLSMPDGRILSYYDYGAPNGRPVLLLMPTTPGAIHAAFRLMMFREGIRIISPTKPGSAHTTNVPRGWGASRLAQDYRYLLDHLGLSRCTVAGHCSGGVYALRFAERYPDRVSRVIAIDTGAPMEKLSMLAAMPKVPRRTFFAARFLPHILVMPHNMVAADFHSGPEGERRVIDYFYASHPAERAILSDEVAYRWSRAMIAYSFENVPRLVDDVRRWVQNWAQLAVDVSSNTPVTFVHGTANNQQRWEDVQAFVARNSNMAAIPADAAAQLTWLTHWDLISRVFALPD